LWPYLLSVKVSQPSQYQDSSVEGHHELATEPLTHESLFNINGTPNGAPLFSSHDERDNPVLYFSPGAVAFAHRLIQHFSS
jgi:hypothetical protein